MSRPLLPFLPALPLCPLNPRLQAPLPSILPSSHSTSSTLHPLSCHHSWFAHRFEAVVVLLSLNAVFGFVLALRYQPIAVDCSCNGQRQASGSAKLVVTVQPGELLPGDHLVDPALALTVEGEERRGQWASTGEEEHTGFRHRRRRRVDPSLSASCTGCRCCPLQLPT